MTPEERARLRSLAEKATRLRGDYVMHVCDAALAKIGSTT